MKMINQNEMMALAKGLYNRNIRFSMGPVYNGLQILCDGWDAICHGGSLGHEDGLIEVMGLPQCGGDVIGGFLPRKSSLWWMNFTNLLQTVALYFGKALLPGRRTSAI